MRSFLISLCLVMLVIVGIAAVNANSVVKGYHDVCVDPNVINVRAEVARNDAYEALAAKVANVLGVERPRLECARYGSRVVNIVVAIETGVGSEIRRSEGGIEGTYALMSTRPEKGLEIVATGETTVVLMKDGKGVAMSADCGRTWDR